MTETIPSSQTAPTMREWEFKKGDIVEYLACRWLLLSDETLKHLGGSALGDLLIRELSEAETVAEKIELMPLLEPHIEVAMIRDGQPLPTEWEKTFLANDVKAVMTLHIRDGKTLFKK